METDKRTDAYILRGFIYKPTVDIDLGSFTTESVFYNHSWSEGVVFIQPQILQ
jgi:hypothetical protein